MANLVMMVPMANPMLVMMHHHHGVGGQGREAESGNDEESSKGLQHSVLLRLGTGASSKRQPRRTMVQGPAAVFAQSLRFCRSRPGRISQTCHELGNWGAIVGHADSRSRDSAHHKTGSPSGLAPPNGRNGCSTSRRRSQSKTDYARACLTTSGKRGGDDATSNDDGDATSAQMQELRSCRGR
jgi:hypothetical protein